MTGCQRSAKEKFGCIGTVEANNTVPRVDRRKEYVWGSEDLSDLRSPLRLL